MKLEQLIKALNDYRVNADVKDVEVNGISCNSKEVLADSVFVAIRGVDVDGHKFLDEVIERGVRVIVVESGVALTQRREGLIWIEVGDTRKALARLAAAFYGYPGRNIKVVGITGTNGKTTITYLIEAILKEKGSNPAVIGTVNYRYKGKEFPSGNTTPGSLTLQEMLAGMKKEGVNYLAMEVSSHALTQDRIEGIDFSSAIFTNLTQDHLDYHRTMEDYFQAKARLFNRLSSNSFAVINNDDAYGRRLKELTSCRVITYGIDTPAQVSARQLETFTTHSEFMVTAGREVFSLKTTLIGRHNVLNILAAIAWAYAEGIDLEIARSSLEKFSSVPGRLEKVDYARGISVFVDYAHTEDALRNVITTLKNLPFRRVIVVFGCGGDRDKTKRPKMGRVVTELADYAIITSDNPRSEDPHLIIDNIRSGIKKNNYIVEADRRQAIQKALSIAGTRDAVLVAGKGHEDYQVVKGQKTHFNDREVIVECLQSLS